MAESATTPSPTPTPISTPLPMNERALLEEDTIEEHAVFFVGDVKIPLSLRVRKFFRRFGGRRDTTKSGSVPQHPDHAAESQLHVGNELDDATVVGEDSIIEVSEMNVGEHDRQSFDGSTVVGSTVVGESSVIGVPETAVSPIIANSDTPDRELETAVAHIEEKSGKILTAVFKPESEPEETEKQKPKRKLKERRQRRPKDDSHIPENLRGHNMFSVCGGFY